MPIRFDHPQFLWLLLLAGPILWLGIRSMQSLPQARKWTAIGIRLFVLLFLVFMLAGVQWVRWHNDLTVVAVVDRSESVERFARRPGAATQPGAASGSKAAPAGKEESAIDPWVEEWVDKASGAKPTDDRFGLVAFDGRPSVKTMPSPIVSFDSNVIDQPVEGTDIGSALRLGMAMFPADSGKRLLLVTDGNQNAANSAIRSDADGAGGNDLLEAAREARAAGVPIDVLPIEYSVDDAVIVDGVYAPTEARTGQTVGLRVVLRAARPTPGTLYLSHDKVPVNLSPDGQFPGQAISERDWTSEDAADSSGARFLCVKLIDLPAGVTGVNRFEATFEPDKKHRAIAGNNKAQTFTLVHGKGRVLFVDSLGPGPGEILPNVIRDRGVDLDVIPPEDFPSRPGDLQPYDAVIFQNISADMLIPGQHKLIEKYVDQMGGGFIMIGGPDSFGAGAWTHTAVDKILPVDCEIPSQTVLPSGALVLVIDRSGSMAETITGSTQDKETLVNEASVLALESLYPQDYVGVVAFDTEANWVVPLQMNRDPGTIATQIRSIRPGGGTAIYSGLKAAVDALEPLTADKAAVKHIILMTDGDSQDGDYVGVVKRMVKNGITFSTVGVGDDVNPALLTSLAQMGGGTYYPITNANRLPKVFIKEARTLRKKLIKELDFTPKVVQTGSPIMQGINGVPPLKGLILTARKRDPRIFTPLLGPDGEPVFAHWQVGLGQVAAFTSDASNRWATPWLKWSGYPDFWTRTLRAVARPGPSKNYDLMTSLRNDRLSLRLDAASGEPDATKKSASNAGGRGAAGFEDFLHVAGSVVLPDGSVEPVALHQTGPGLYETQMPADKQGNYIVSLFADDGHGGRQAIYGGATRPPGPELRVFNSNRAILEQVAAMTGGRVLDPANTSPQLLFNREGIEPTRSMRPLWPALLMLLLPLFIIDVATRRIAWDFAAMWRDMNARRRAVQSRLATREVDSQATLSALKARVDGRWSKKPQSPPESGKPAQVAAPRIDLAPVRPDRKFEADPSLKPAQNIVESMGGPTAKTGESSPAGKDKPQSPKADPQTTRSLLEAKRRAREKMDEQG